MGRMRGLTIAASALALLSACDQAPRQEPAATADTGAIVKQLKDIEAQWAKNYAARDAAALASLYSADGAVANPGVPLLEGAEIRPMLDQFVADPNANVEFASDRVQVAASGDLAYTRGRFTMRSTDPATKQPRTDTGNYLTVWKKQADDSWKAVEDFVVPGPPTAAGGEAAG